MTTGIITIEDLVRREVIYCVSGLIGGITQNNQCLDEELIKELWTGPINDDGDEREVVGHWIVSDWLCKKLKEHGQSVAEDVYNLSVWARADSGPISDDDVIQEIYNELVGVPTRANSGIDWDAACEAIAVEGNRPFTVDGYWGIKNTLQAVWKIDPIFETKEHAICEYYKQYLGGEESLPVLK